MSAPQTYPQERIRIFDRQGFPLAEFRAAVERSLVIAAEGRAEFTYPSRKTDVVNEKVLQYGNWLLVESSALPPWVGVIDLPREWSPRAGAVHAYTPERVFRQRRGPLEKKITASAGAHLEWLLTRTNEAEPTIIRAGNIWRGKRQLDETFNPSRLSEDLKRIQERSAEEYIWRPETDESGKLVVYVDWVERLGDQTDALLHEGKGGGNMERLNNVLVEDGEIYNDILAYGDGMAWGSKPKYTVTDPESISKYGLRQHSESFMGVTDVKGLQRVAEEFLVGKKNPRRTFHVNALNIGDTFKYIRLGNILKLQFENMGFSSGVGLSTYARITGMIINSAVKNKVELSLEEVIYT